MPTASGNYIHLAANGAVFVIRDTGEQLWVDRAGLRGELERFGHAGKPLLFSRDDPAGDPPSHVVENFRLIVDVCERAGVPIRLLDEPHPEALVPVSERRTITRDPP